MVISRFGPALFLVGLTPIARAQAPPPCNGHKRAHRIPAGGEPLHGKRAQHEGAKGKGRGALGHRIARGSNRFGFDFSTGLHADDGDKSSGGEP